MICQAAFGRGIPGSGVAPSSNTPSILGRRAWLPGRVGVDEYGTKRLAPIVGFSPVVGVTLALIRKGRMLVWAAVGLALMARRGLSIRHLASEAPRP